MDIIISPAGQVVFSEEKWFVKYKKIFIKNKYFYVNSLFM